MDERETVEKISVASVKRQRNMNSRVSFGLQLQSTQSSVVEKRESKVLELGNENSGLLVRVYVEVPDGL